MKPVKKAFEKAKGGKVGIGYKNPRMVNGEMKGTRYEYPIKDKKHERIVRKSGGEIK